MQGMLVFKWFKNVLFVSHFHCIRSPHHRKYVAALLSDQARWQNISRIELGSSSPELPAASQLELEL